MNLYKELSSVLRLFSENDLNYAVCGGIAVAFHGYERFTKDIDILICEEGTARPWSEIEAIRNRTELVIPHAIHFHVIATQLIVVGNLVSVLNQCTRGFCGKRRAIFLAHRNNFQRTESITQTERLGARGMEHNLL